MAEEVNQGNISNSGISSEEDIRSDFVQILITTGLVLGPVLLPFVIIWPNLFDLIPYMLEISGTVTIIFIFSSWLSAYRKEKKSQVETS